MTTDPEALLRGQQIVSDAAWREAILCLVSRLGEFLQQEIELVDYQVDDTSFTCRVASRARLGGPLAIEWWGMLGMELIEGEPRVGGTLFLYSMKQRVGVDSPKGSAIELVFERRADGRGAWRLSGWALDIDGQWEHVRAPWS